MIAGLHSFALVVVVHRAHPLLHLGIVVVVVAILGLAGWLGIRSAVRSGIEQAERRRGNPPQEPPAA